MMNDPKTKKPLFQDEKKDKKPMMNDPKTKKALGGMKDDKKKV